MKTTINDKTLNINTSGIRDWHNNNHYFRYEPTSYNLLNLLFEELNLNDDDVFVDFGSGKGRVVFYTNYLFNCFTKAIEANHITHDEAINNLHGYLKVNPDATAKMKFELSKAEHYQINKEDNIFYFFNSFSVVIFKKVISNILESLKESPREITLIMYYSFPDYLNFINEHTPFKLIKKITEPNNPQPQQNFLLYRCQLEKH